MEHQNTEFDGKKALIIGVHPHTGVTAICMGADLTNAGWGMKFRNANTGEEFYVFNGKNARWIKD